MLNVLGCQCRALLQHPETFNIRFKLLRQRCRTSFSSRDTGVDFKRAIIAQKLIKANLLN